MSDDLNQEIDEAISATDTDILNEAFQDEAPKAEPENAAPEQAEAAPQAEQPRNERGQFAPKEQAKADAEPKAGNKAEEDAPIPSWRAREIAEERRQAQAERDQLRAELAKMQARVAAQQPKQPQQQQDIDPLLDPQGFANKLRSEFNEQLSRVELNANLKMAHRFHGEKFEKAYEAVILQAQNGNQALVQHLTRQADPGEAIVNWYTQQEVLREVGNDPAAYRQKLLEEALKDPEFMKKAVEAARGQASGQPQGQPGRPNTVVQVPPSLSRATGTNANVDPTESDNSERAVFDYAFR